ncbi:putative benzoate 4-monooxygenase cytochrome P450, partial [Coniella lustricola]
VYNLFLHPLSKIPGPKARAASNLPNIISLISGVDFENVKELHDKYGKVVRLAPDILSFNTAEAFQDIYGFHHQKGQIPKDLDFYLADVNSQRSLINADDVHHARVRRLIAHGFSNSALQGQEELLTTYFDLFVDRLKVLSRTTGTADMTDFFNFLAWDIIGDLSLGKSFGLLEEPAAPTWMEKVMGSSNSLFLYWIGNWIPAFGIPFRLWLRIPGMTDARTRLKNFTAEQVNARLAEKPERQDFISYILRYNVDQEILKGELYMTTRTFLNAGSDTTASTLTWCLWEILHQPDIYARVQKEVRDHFQHAKQITLHSSARDQLPFLFAVLEETLRKDPPTIGPGFARKTFEPTMVDGTMVPPGVRVGVPHYATFRSEKNFRDPEEFIPERWLGDPLYKDDRTDAFRPFQLGPRVCLGKNLAYAEMMSALARLFYYFDMSLTPDSSQWGKGRNAYFFWVKPPLNVNLKLSSRLQEDEKGLAKLLAKQ